MYMSSEMWLSSHTQACGVSPQIYNKPVHKTPWRKYQENPFPIAMQNT